MRLPALVLTTGLVATLVTGGLFVSTAPQAARAADTVEDDHYVDCSRSGSGEGSRAEPLTGLEQVNGQDFEPGDRILFRRGTTCTGTFRPSGSGEPGAPIEVDVYGPGRQRPTIDGAGAAQAVHLFNVEYWELSGLAITNAANPGTPRNGVQIELRDYGVGEHFVLQDLKVHDVLGDDNKNPRGSHAILVAVTGDQERTNFEDVRLLDNRIDHVDREGITFTSSWSHRPDVGSPNGPSWTPAEEIVVRGNELSDLGGDGIVMGETAGALVEYNTVRGFQRRSAGYNAGIWPWNSDEALFQFNDVSGGESTRDGMAYDIDQGNNGTVFQYNLSHDNAGGFFLICNANGTIRGAVIRYNISQNDAHRGFETCTAGPIESAHVYNNTIWIGPGTEQVAINENNELARNVDFENNLFVNAGAPGAMTMRLQSGSMTFDSNVYHRVGNVPEDPNGDTSDPLLTEPGKATGRDDAAGYRLGIGSPALDSGVHVPDDGGRDYFGNKVAGTLPNRGAYGGDGVE